MISIQSHLSVPDPQRHLDALSDSHWQRYRDSAVAGCREIAAESKAKPVKYRRRYANNEVAAVARQQKFFEFLLDDGEKKLKRLFVAEPPELATLSAEIMGLLHPGDLYAKTRSGLQQTPFGRHLIDKVFRYEAFRNSAYCGRLFEQLEFSEATCPYCNYHMLHVLEVPKEEPGAMATGKARTKPKTELRTYFQIDHFHPKVTHPFLALSFYNLIPSCYSCNSQDKLAQQFSIDTHVHPYHESFDDVYEFRLSLRAMWGMAQGEVGIHRKATATAKDDSLSAFRLREKYRSYAPLAINLHQRFLRYESRLRTGELQLFHDAVLQGVSLNPHHILRTERAKLKRDLIRQFDVAGYLDFDSIGP